MSGKGCDGYVHGAGGAVGGGGAGFHRKVLLPTFHLKIWTSLTGSDTSEVDTDIARGVALGDLDPITKEPFNLSPASKYTSKALSAGPIPTVSRTSHHLSEFV